MVSIVIILAYFMNSLLIDANQIIIVFKSNFLFLIGKLKYKKIKYKKIFLMFSH